MRREGEAPVREGIEPRLSLEFVGEEEGKVEVAGGEREGGRWECW